MPYLIKQERQDDQKARFNVFKGLSILGVVSIHVVCKFLGFERPGIFGILHYLISFSVPLFMILGGFFLTPKLERISDFKDFLDLIKHLGKRILLPYYIFCLALFVFRFLTSQSVNVSSYLLLFDANTHGLYFIIIYIYAYAFAAVLAYLLVSAGKNKNALLPFIIPLIGMAFFPITNILIPVLPDNIVFKNLSYLAYFLIGIPLYGSCKRISLSSVRAKVKIVISILFSVLAFTAALYVARKLFGPFRLFVMEPPTVFLLIYSVCAFLVLYIVLEEFELTVRIGKRLFLDRFGEQSLFIFLLHPYFIYALPFLVPERMTHGNIFVLPWMIATYLITFLSLQIYDNMLPPFLKRVFSRITTRQEWVGNS